MTQAAGSSDGAQLAANAQGRLAPRGVLRRRPLSKASAVLGMLALVPLVAACGSSPKSPGVADIGSTPTTSAGSSNAGSPSSGGLPKDFMAKLLSYSVCMRSHGIADFPDPTAGPNGQGGGFQINGGSGSDLNPSNPPYGAANKACQHLLPYGGSVPKLTAQQLVAETK